MMCKQFAGREPKNPLGWCLSSSEWGFNELLLVRMSQSSFPEVKWSNSSLDVSSKSIILNNISHGGNAMWQPKTCSYQWSIKEHMNHLSAIDSNLLQSPVCLIQHQYFVLLWLLKLLFLIKMNYDRKDFNMFSCSEWVWSELDMENSFQSQGSFSKAGVNTQTPDDGMLPALDGLDTVAVTGSLLFVCARTTSQD